MAKRDKRRKTTAFGQAVIGSLSEFLETAKNGGQITARTVKLNLEPGDYGAKEVERTRERLGVSQAVFAQLLPVSLKLVQHREQGIRKPSPLACRMLDDINRDPQQWLQNHLSDGVVKNAVRDAKTPHRV
jgi:DNA-binding transcriptional regulator YiaG